MTRLQQTKLYGLGKRRPSPRHARACPGYPRRDEARLVQNAKAFGRCEQRESLAVTLRAPTWMAGTSPAMTVTAVAAARRVK
jgi:hypothetical protein